MLDATKSSVPGRQLSALGRDDAAVAIAELSVPLRRHEADGRRSPALPGCVARERPSLLRWRIRAHESGASSI
jgi:hypothetical protein